MGLRGNTNAQNFWKMGTVEFMRLDPKCAGTIPMGILARSLAAPIIVVGRLGGRKSADDQRYFQSNGGVVRNG